MAGILTVHSIRDNKNNGYVTIEEKENNTCGGIVEYEIENQKYCVITRVEVDDNYQEDLDRLINAAFEDIVENGLIPVPGCDLARSWYEKTKAQGEKKQTLMEIEPNHADGSKKMRTDDETGYELFIEYPVREACRKMTDKGIVTIMSSANKEDAISAGQPEKNNDVLYIGQNQHFSIGNGYAWIMIDYNRLLSENKDLVKALNRSEILLELSEDARKRFARNCEVNRVPMDQRELVKFYRVVGDSLWLGGHSLTREQDPEFAVNSNILIQKNSLSYHGSDYDAVVIRYPVDENTKVDEIVDYYNSIIELFKEKAKIKFTRQ